MAYLNRSDRSSASKRHYEANKAEYMARNKVNQSITKTWFTEYKKGMSCVKCGENHPAVLDFHHLDPKTKDFTVSKAVRWSLARLKKEIAKCVVLCANCHRKEHAK